MPSTQLLFEVCLVEPGFDKFKPRALRTEMFSSPHGLREVQTLGSGSTLFSKSCSWLESGKLPSVGFSSFSACQQSARSFLRAASGQLRGCIISAVGRACRKVYVSAVLQQRKPTIPGHGRPIVGTKSEPGLPTPLRLKLSAVLELPPMVAVPLPMLEWSVLGARCATEVFDQLCGCLVSRASGTITP